MSATRLPAAACAVFMASFCLSGIASAQEQVSSRGAEFLAPLKVKLQSALMTGMQKGTLNAIDVCKDQAPAIADSLSVEGVQLGRTSHRLRNPANTAPDWVNPVLASYLDDRSDRAPRTVSLSDNREGYVEPISTKPLCLACHGTALAPDVASLIETIYPQDDATGFELDELRGVYWVEYPATIQDER